MSASDTLEFSSPAERAEELVRFLGGAEEQTLAGLVAAGRYAELFTAVLARQAEIFKGHTDEDIEGVFTLLLSLLGSVEPSRHDAVLDATVVALTSSAAEKPLLRLHLVTNVFNSIAHAEHKEAKLNALKNLLRFAADARLLDLLQPYLAGAASWPTRWSLSPEQAGALYLLIAQCLEKSGAVEDAQGFLVRYLGTLEGASDAALAGARAWAKTAALNFVRAPAVSQKPAIARLAAVRALASDPEHSRLLELVEIFAHAHLSDYLAFHAKHSAYLADLGVEHELSLETMRLLSLCSLAASNNVVPYDAIAAALQCRVEEVEGWVVRGISGGLMDARIDQAAATVTVTRSVQREFSSTQWRSLKDRLETWSGNIGQMLRAMEEVA